MAEERELDEPMRCACGREFKYAGAYAKHKVKCDGRLATRGRIDGGSGSSTSGEEPKAEPPKSARRSDPPRGRTTRKKTRARSSVPRERKPARTVRLPIPKAAVGVACAGVLETLRAEREKAARVVELIDDAIRAVEAIA